jgi:hypothetical protein
MEKIFCQSFLIMSMVFAVFCSFQHIFSKYSIEGVYKKTTIINHSNLIVCGDDSCHIIKKYTIAENNTFNCFEENLFIIFDLSSNNKTKLSYSGFLQPNNEKILVDKHTKSESCRKIKRFGHKNFYKLFIFILMKSYFLRYHVNDNNVLILFVESLYLFDNSKVEEFILWELLKNFDFFTAILYKLNICCVLNTEQR